MKKEMPKNGQQVYYDENMNLNHVEKWKDGIKISVRYFYHNMEKTVSREVFFDKLGKFHGRCSKFYKNGSLGIEEHFKNGFLHGKKTYFHPNGQKWVEINYLNNRRDGKYTRWSEDGKKNAEGNYKDGKKDGKWTSEKYLSTEWHEAEFKDDICISGYYPEDPDLREPVTFDSNAPWGK